MSEEKWDAVLNDIKGELSELANFVEKTKKGLDGIESTVKAGNEKLPEATDHIRCVTGDLEKAANTIMSILERVMREQERSLHLLGILKSWAEDLEEKNASEGLGIIQVLEGVIVRMKADMMDILTNLSFHDLSGQKLRKVMSAFSDVQSKILELAVHFGLQSNKDPSDKEGLLDELKDVSVSMELKQDVVDKILKEMQ